jgi:membrane protein implicated in regulation of membrane protease activity
MNKIKEFLSNLSVFLFNMLYIGAILTLPMIGMACYIAFDWWWASMFFVTITYLLLEFYGRYYFEFNKDTYKDLKLKIHHDVEKNFVWVESNDTIDSIIDIDIVKHVKFKLEDDV